MSMAVLKWLFVSDSIIKKYIAEVGSEIDNCYNQVQSLKNYNKENPRSNVTVGYSKSIGYAMNSGLETYNQRHYVSFVFSLDPDCSEELEILNNQKLTIELLDGNEKVIEVFTRRFTPENMVHIQKQKLTFTLEYIKKFIDRMSEEYLWTPVGGSISFEATAKETSSICDGSKPVDGRIMLKIDLPDRIELLAANNLLMDKT